LGNGQELNVSFDIEGAKDSQQMTRLRRHAVWASCNLDYLEGAVEGHMCIRVLVVSLLSEESAPD
jgi:hypothetical protein